MNLSSMVQFIPLLILIAPAIIIFLVIFLKKKKNEKPILKNEIKKFLWVNFNIKGRLNREDYWYYGYGLFWSTLIVYTVTIILIQHIVAYIFEQLSLSVNIYYYFYITTNIVFIFPLYLMYGTKFVGNKIKRLHDNNKSGWFLLWTIIPFIGQLVGLYVWVTNWFMKGTSGSNDFGKDSLDEKKEIPITTFKDAAFTLGVLIIICAVFALYAFAYLYFTGKI